MVIATGFFDGVHLGHRLVIEQLVKAAATRKDESMIITFWPHPRNVLQLEARNLRLLTSLQEKEEILYSLGVDKVEVIPFSKEFSELSTEAYLTELMKRYGAKAILLGYDNRIGNNSAGASEVSEIATSLGLEVINADVVHSTKGYAISSTKIREALASGDVKLASKMLGYDYFLYGVIVAGQKLGRTLGFPTANMQLYEPLKCLPEDGVYLVKVNTIGLDLYGMTNIGYRPTVSGNGLIKTIETNIFDFDQDIYGLDMHITFLDRIRNEVKFNSLDDLKKQLELDREVCLEKIKNI